MKIKKVETAWLSIKSPQPQGLSGGYMTHSSDAVCRITTDDGSYGMKGFVTDQFHQLIDKQQVDFVLASGPPIMMKAVSTLTRPYHITPMVSLNPIMIDGTGMCGGCRVSVGGKTQCVWVDGPEFNGHQVDFERLMLRQRMYLHDEKLSLEHFEEACNLGIQN